MGQQILLGGKWHILILKCDLFWDEMDGYWWINLMHNELINNQLPWWCGLRPPRDTRTSTTLKQLMCALPHPCIRVRNREPRLEKNCRVVRLRPFLGKFRHHVCVRFLRTQPVRRIAHHAPQKVPHPSPFLHTLVWTLLWRPSRVKYLWALSVTPP